MKVRGLECNKNVLMVLNERRSVCINTATDYSDPILCSVLYNLHLIMVEVDTGGDVHLE